MSSEKKKTILENLANKNFRSYRDEKRTIDEFIIDKSAKEEVDKLTGNLLSSIEDTIKRSVEENVKPNMQFTHVNEHGLRIWGKKENMSFGKKTIIDLFREFSGCLDSTTFKRALYNAGCKAAYGFFDEFRQILNIDGDDYLPLNTIDFMKLLFKFDSRSSWWSDGTNIMNENGYISVTVIKPFTKYPWYSNGNHDYASYLEGYLLTLYNLCCDYIHVSNIIEKKHFMNKHAYRIEYKDEPKADMSVFYIYEDDTIPKEWSDIDISTYYCSELVHADLKKMYKPSVCHEQIKNLAQELSVIMKDKTFFEEINKQIEVQENMLVIWGNEYLKYEQIEILSQLRDRYDNFKKNHIRVKHGL